MAECEILIVAAHRQVREVLHQIFLGEGYTCRVASDGHEGLEAFNAQQAPLVLAELKMAGMTGVEFLRRVRSVDADVAVIVLAESLDVEMRTECLELGAHAYLMKPLNVGELQSAVEQALAARHRAPPTPRGVPRHRSDDAGTGEITPEQFLDIFEYGSREYPASQFSDGLPIIRAWMDLLSRQTVSQVDLDELFDRFTGVAEGMRIYDLWIHLVRWARSWDCRCRAGTTPGSDPNWCVDPRSPLHGPRSCSH